MIFEAMSRVNCAQEKYHNIWKGQIIWVTLTLLRKGHIDEITMKKLIDDTSIVGYSTLIVFFLTLSVSLMDWLPGTVFLKRVS